jgi:transcriptional regulator with XRE-family HTH domain
MNTIGNKIRLLREEKGFSQENLASALDITQSNYARLEKDDNRISVPRLIIIARTLETTVAELVGEKLHNIVNQNNNHEANTYLQSTFHSDKDHIQTLKNEIEYLKNIVDNLLKSKVVI